MFRDAIRKLSLRKKLMILASVGVLFPLLILTYMQYRSLAELQNKTKGAFKDNLRQGITIVEHQMKQRLEDIAVRTLDPIGNSQSAQEFERYFAEVKRSYPEIEEIFVFGNAYASLFEKARVTESFVDVNRKYLFVDRYLFVSSNGAGVRLTEAFIRDDLIAGSIAKTLNTYHANTSSPDIALTITDENRRVLYSNTTTQGGYFLETNLDRPFSNWKAVVGLKNTNLDALARDSFLHSAGATLLVLLVLVGGVVLTLRATDREARLAQAKSNFVSNVSHELKTPLSLLTLFSEILELGRVNSDEKKKEYYGIIRHESLRLNKVIDNILDFSKIEAGRKTYVLVPGDVADVIANVLSSYRYQIINSGFDVQTNIQPDLPPVLMDRDAMEQAVSNLLDNAIKYSRDVKQLAITAETRGASLCIEIADHGIGIPRAEQAKIFDKFYRVGNGLVHDVKGSGLGLSLVKHIIEAHHGTITVEGEAGKGSRFTILLPIAPDKRQEN
jgi:signal transduction histidine kinase